MIKSTRKSLPLTINKNGITHILLSPIERYAIKAESMGISVIRVNIRPKELIKIKDINEAMYYGRISSKDNNRLVSEHNRKYKSNNFYYYYDKSCEHLEKEIRRTA